MELTDRRKRLYGQLRNVGVKSSGDKTAEVREQTALLTERIVKLRREDKLCVNIARRSELMKEEIKRHMERGKENIWHEQFRGRR